MKKIVGLLLLAGLSMNAPAFEFEQKKLYIGGGMAFNTFSSGNAAGYQWFTGYDLSQYMSLGHRLTFVPEVGFTSSGNAVPVYNGLWANAVVRYKMNAKMKYINRLGLDFGDAFGTMMGAGVEYIVDEHITTRGEIVMRGDFTSYQVNVLYWF